MPQLSPGKMNAPMRAVTVLDLVTLLGNVYRGAAMADVGFEDAEQTLQAITAKLNMKIRVPQSDIESALWACNLLDEKKKFWHPQGALFEQFIRKLVGPDHTFDRTYNLILEKP